MLSFSDFCLLTCRMDCIVVTPDVPEGNEECLEAVQGGREVTVHPDNTHLRLRPTLKAVGS
jgi:hypothetical protein